MIDRDVDPVLAELRPVIEEFVPIAKRLGSGRYAISIGGSYGKGSHDANSDVDFRLFADDIIATATDMWEAVREPSERWKQRGVVIDSIWARRIGDIEETLAKWLDGQLVPEECFWTVWGYHLLPDLYHQRVIEDPNGVIAAWKAALRAYPPKLKQAVLDKHLHSLRYWRDDYHYLSKVRRKDVVFLAGLSARLVHDMAQILFALNEVYYVGDGQNLPFVAGFARKPPDFAARVEQALYPPPSDQVFEQQRATLLRLIDDIEELVRSAEAS